MAKGDFRQSWERVPEGPKPEGPPVYTPTTEEVRDGYSWFATNSGDWDVEAKRAEGRAEFYRWLAVHDAEVEARGLEKIAGDIRARRNDGVPDWAILDDLLFTLSVRQVGEGK